LKKLFILAVLALLILSSCSPREPDNIEADMIDIETGEVFRLANNQAVDFYFYYPENFVLDKKAVMISIFINDLETVKNDLDTGAVLDVYVNPNLSAYVHSTQENYTDASQYWEEYMKPSLNEGFQNIIIESGEDIETAGIPGRKYIYSASLGGQDYKFAQVIFFKDREIYILTYTATPSKFDKHSRVLDIVVDTFTFK
jgi:hypothetical protein